MPKTVTKPKPATTVIVARNINKGKDEMEILMTKRQSYLKFLGGFYVFPGGRVEDQDCSLDSINRISKTSEIDHGKACQILKIKYEPENNKEHVIDLGYWIAGIRELFEEIGILLAIDETGMIIKEPVQDRFNEYKTKIINHELKMTDMMKKENLYYAADNLIYYKHFVTPRFSPIRFDTRFFICKIPEEQEIHPLEKEISQVIWIKPQDALNKWVNNDKEFKIIFPQIVSLKDLDNFDLSCFY